jgi:hypothetical protein
LVAIQYESDAASLVRVDPVSLERVDQATVSLDRSAGGWTLSPDGSRAAFGSSEAMVLRMYDLARMGMQWSLEVEHGSGFLSVIAWPTPDRLLAFVQPCCGWTGSVVSVDTQTGRVVSRSRLEGQFRDSSPTREGAVVLVARPNRIGPARLGVVRTDGVAH